MENIKEKLIGLIKKYNKKCTDCGKIFLGATFFAETESSI